MRVKKFEVETAAMIGTPGAESDAHERLYQKIERFYEENADFFRYYRMGRTEFDRYYFLRDGCPAPGQIEFLPSIVDLACCTIHSYKVATIMAYMKLEQDLRLQGTKERSGLYSSDDERKFKLKWTATKSGLTELVYAFNALGVFNEGNATLAEIVRYLEDMFDVKLGNTSRIFQEIMARKKGRTSFLDRLTKGMLGRIDEIEEGDG